MDRDKRWDRVEQAYDLLTAGTSEHKSTDPVAAIRESYAREIGDEFVKAISVVDQNNAPVATIKSGDSVIFFNFRSDRAREITRALTDENFDGFSRKQFPKVHFTCMTQYDATLPLPIAFAPKTHNNILVQVLAQHGIKNIRIAETEKYAHVTFFFNGGVETQYPFEERVLVPSPKVATYDLKPDMSAHEVTAEVLKALEEDRAKVFIINFANADMVGHTGMMGPAIRAIENLDVCLGKIVPAFQQKGGAVLITADHGNAEEMEDESGDPQTAHTTNPVPLLYVNDNDMAKLRAGGALEDLAPTMLGILGIQKPAEMTGQDLRE
jgi:2,3-bisphosphoglycerate-independent phosphoglycerate mutase